MDELICDITDEDSFMLIFSWILFF
jgi:hypothetical protein